MSSFYSNGGVSSNMCSGCNNSYNRCSCTTSCTTSCATGAYVECVKINGDGNLEFQIRGSHMCGGSGCDTCIDCNDDQVLIVDITTGEEIPADTYTKSEVDVMINNLRLELGAK